MSAIEQGAEKASNISVVKSVYRNGFKKGRVSNFRSFPIETFVDTEDDDAYTRNRTALIRVVTALHLARFDDRNPVISIQRIFRGMTHPRTALMLVGEPGQSRGHWVGYGLFRGISIYDEDDFETDPQEVDYSSRALMPGFEGQGVGTHMLVESLKIFNPDWLVLMTQNEASIRTVQHLREKGLVKQHYPFGEPMGEVTYDTNKAAQDVMLATRRVVRLSNISRVHDHIGLAERELSEIGMNRAAIETITDDETGRLRGQFRAWEMNRERGDVFYVTAEIDQEAVAKLNTVA